MHKYLGWVVCGLSLVAVLGSGGCGPAGARGPGEARDLSGDSDGGVGSGGGDLAGANGGDDLGAPGCPTSCSPGAKSCDGNGVRTCQPSGACNDWSAPVACGAGNVCSGGVCAASCSNQCTAGATYCSANGFRTCITTLSGCTDWSPSVTACPSGQVCSGGACTGGCTDRCAPNAKQCTGAAVQMCERKVSGCLDWSDPSPCGGTLVPSRTAARSRSRRRP
jgi:hypothetical protein